MRPTPKSRHILALALLAATAAGAALLAWQDDRLSEEQYRAAAASVKRHEPALMTRDILYGDSGIWRLQSPAYARVYDLLMDLTGHRNELLPFRIMTPVVVFIYLCGMYALLLRQTLSWSVSVFMSIVSSTVVFTMGGAYWGVGSLASIQPGAICMAVAPVLVLMYLKHIEGWQILIVFAAAGVLGNIHVETAMNLVIVLLLAYVAQHHFSLKSWILAGACFVAATIAASPYLLYFYTIQEQIAPAHAAVSAATASAAIRLADWEVLYPEMLGNLLSWAPLAAVLVVAAAAALFRIERFQTRDLGFWVIVMMSSMAVAFGLQGVSQAWGLAFNTAPPILGFLKASALVMLPLYVLMGQALTNLFRILPDHRAQIRWTCAAFALAWMVPSDGLRVARYGVTDTVTMFMIEGSKPRYVQKHHERADERRELQNIARWASQNTDPNSVFIVDQMEFRLFARRAVVTTRDDFASVYHLAPWRLEEWLRLMTEQRKAMTAAGHEDSQMAALVNALSQRPPFEATPQWFTVLRVGEDASATLRPIASEAWGKYYQIYPVR